MQNASNDNSKRSDQLSEELNFLDNQFLLITDKPYMASDDKSPANDVKTDVYIYKVSTGELIYDSTKDKLERPFIDVQVGFFIDANQFSDEDNLVYHFLIKCKKWDFQIRIRSDTEIPEIMSESA